MVLGMVLDVVLDNSTQLADNQYWVLDKQIILFFSIVERLYPPVLSVNQHYSLLSLKPPFLLINYIFSDPFFPVIQ